MSGMPDINVPYKTIIRKKFVNLTPESAINIASELFLDDYILFVPPSRVREGLRIMERTGLNIELRTDSFYEPDSWCMTSYFETENGLGFMGAIYCDNRASEIG